MVILGVDPGSRKTGYGVVDAASSGLAFVECGVISCSDSRPLEARLVEIHDGIRRVIERVRPEVMAVEDLFHSANSRTALVLGHVRGVVLLAGAQAGLSLRSLSPATVKAQVASHGRASKDQVAFMVAQQLQLAAEPDARDATDALAVAICAARLETSPLTGLVAVRGVAS